MIPEVTIKITMTEGAFAATAGETLVTAGGEAIPPPPQEVEGVSEMEAYVPTVPLDVSAGMEGDVAPPAALEGAEEEIAVPPPPQETVTKSAEGDLSEFFPPGEGQEFAED